MPVAKDVVEGFLGKRVHLETTEFHHLVGTLSARRDGSLVLLVAGREMTVKVTAVVSLTEAGPHEVDYLK